MPEPPIKFVSENEIRRIFNDNNYLYRINSGDFTKETIYDEHVKRTKPKIPKCSRSQIIAYRDSSGQDVTKVHRYLRRDGSLGGSGKPDPKWLLHENILYLPDKNMA
jgi:hypothetical protein